MSSDDPCDSMVTLLQSAIMMSEEAVSKSNTALAAARSALDLYLQNYKKQGWTFKGYEKASPAPPDLEEVPVFLSDSNADIVDVDSDTDNTDIVEDPIEVINNQGRKEELQKDRKNTKDIILHNDEDGGDYDDSEDEKVNDEEGNNEDGLPESFTAIRSWLAGGMKQYSKLGVYRKQGGKHNGWPVWERLDGTQKLFYHQDGRWVIGPDPASCIGFVCTVEGNWSRPDQVTGGWMAYKHDNFWHHDPLMTVIET